MNQEDLNFLKEHVEQQWPKGSWQYRKAIGIMQDYTTELIAAQVKKVVQKHGPEAFDLASVDMEDLWHGMSASQRVEALLSDKIFNIYDAILSEEKVKA